MAFNTKNYEEQGGAKLVIGGTLQVSGGQVVPASGTQPAHLAALKVDYATGNLDAEAEVIAAVNATNTRINAIMTALEGLGIFAAS